MMDAAGGASPLISVIVPVCNIDRYIGTCIESILDQTYERLEILLVDDGSTDRSPEICDLYGRKDGRIRVIHQANRGLVSARKAGLRASNGDHISYVDGDDWIESGFIESMYAAASSTGADIVCAGHSRDLFARSERSYDTVPAGVYEGEKLEGLWKQMISYGGFYRPGITTYVWGKLFRREILSPVQMSVDDRIRIGEDGAVTYPALLRCGKVVVMRDTSYHYRQREDSMLKQSDGYPDEAKRLRYLYRYLSDRTEGDAALQRQVTDYVLSIAIMRSGGKLPRDTYSAFGKAYYDRDVVIYSAGTFGQQMAKRFRESGHCRVAAWVDDDYREYRRCCLDVDPVESITGIGFDYILVATVDPVQGAGIVSRLQGLGIEREKILTVAVPDRREELLDRFLDAAPFEREEEKRRQRGNGVISYD